MIQNCEWHDSLQVIQLCAAVSGRTWSCSHAFGSGGCIMLAFGI
jgi:hypothetical protein